jgi:3-deoxy-D-manno-octulosonic-acid transferase
VRHLYTLLVRLAVPFATLLVLWRGLRRRDYWRGGSARFGLGAAAAAPGGIWVHAVSVGEVQAAAVLIEALRAREPQVCITLTCATPTGRARARAVLAPEVDVRFGPYDLPGAVRRTLARLRPALLIVIETELWPNLLHECTRQRVPILLASARVSVRTERWYRRLPGLLRPALASNVWAAAQTEPDAARLCSLGVPAERARVVGNIKFDRQLPPHLAERGARLRARYAGYRPLWVAGSTHPIEERLVLDAHQLLRAQSVDAVLVLAPRHRERFDAVAALLAERRWAYVRRSAADANGNAAVLLLDSLGELLDFYAAADAAFVGGSLVAVGGHNLLEPAALGLPVLSGPHQFNAPDIARLLTAEGGLTIVHSAAELAQSLIELFADETVRRRQGTAARAVVEANRGAIEHVLAFVSELRPA